MQPNTIDIEQIISNKSLSESILALKETSMYLSNQMESLSSSILVSKDRERLLSSRDAIIKSYDEISSHITPIFKKVRSLEDSYSQIKLLNQHRKELFIAQQIQRIIEMSQNKKQISDTIDSLNALSVNQSYETGVTLYFTLKSFDNTSGNYQEISSYMDEFVNKMIGNFKSCFKEDDREKMGDYIGILSSVGHLPPLLEFLFKYILGSLNLNDIEDYRNAIAIIKENLYQNYIYIQSLFNNPLQVFLNLITNLVRESVFRPIKELCDLMKSKGTLKHLSTIEGVYSDLLTFRDEMCSFVYNIDTERSLFHGRIDEFFLILKDKYTMIPSPAIYLKPQLNDLFTLLSDPSHLILDTYHSETTEVFKDLIECILLPKKLYAFNVKKESSVIQVPFLSQPLELQRTLPDRDFERYSMYPTLIKSRTSIQEKEVLDKDDFECLLYHFNMLLKRSIIFNSIETQEYLMFRLFSFYKEEFVDEEALSHMKRLRSVKNVPEYGSLSFIRKVSKDIERIQMDIEGHYSPAPLFTQEDGEDEKGSNNNYNRNNQGVSKKERYSNKIPDDRVIEVKTHGIRVIEDLLNDLMNYNARACCLYLNKIIRLFNSSFSISETVCKHIRILKNGLMENIKNEDCIESAMVEVCGNLSVVYWIDWEI
eukprot:GHVP01060076.1.p1 GENE.GHVP01060076.1~~GHVP01060076.1.p1  ORF type:complete len:652 (+),score=81.25 GHVP01060076.1:1364-3319(+)